MIHYMSKLFLSTLRENPSDAEFLSHRLLVRAGFVRKIIPGIYTLLPFGQLAVQNIEKIIREEMNKIGGIEVALPSLLNVDLFKKSGRLEKYGETLFTLEDRKKNPLMLSPTHEEIFTALLKDETKSYKNFPQIVYQIQKKYRDEERPRGGILRGREFIMKDSYSFDLADEDLSKSYNKHREAYIKIFNRIGLNFSIVKAFSGAMGGSKSEEFLAETKSGEDTFVKSSDGKLVANVEALEYPILENIEFKKHSSIEKIETKNSETIEKLTEVLKSKNLDYKQILKVLLYKITIDGDQKIIAIGIPGNREIDLKRVAVSLNTEDIELLSKNDLQNLKELKKGYIGPKILNKLNIPVYLDKRIQIGTGWIIGADEENYHYINAIVGKDFEFDSYIEASEIKEGDFAPDGINTLTIAKGVEIGHIFQLGDFYSKKLNFYINNSDGIKSIVKMGSYGIGVTRLLAVIAEQFATENSLLWPYEVSPYDYHIIISSTEENTINSAKEYAKKLSSKNYKVLLDDRNISTGIKFKDWELIGVPKLIIFGKNFLEDKVEVRDRIEDYKNIIQFDIEYTF